LSLGGLGNLSSLCCSSLGSFNCFFSLTLLLILEHIERLIFS
jgi:hypothetical protein